MGDLGEEVSGSENDSGIEVRGPTHDLSREVENSEDDSVTEVGDFVRGGFGDGCCSF